MKGLREKCENPPFLDIFAQNGPFWTFFGQNGQNGNFFQKSVWKIFSLLKALIKCKVSEKSNEWFLRKSGTNEHTDGRTNERTRAKFKVLTN